MAANIRVVVSGEERVARVLRGINPGENPAFVRRALTKGGFLIQREAATKQIKRGGKGRPLPHKLTSRTGTGRRSIRVDRGGLPRLFVDIGSDLKYMQLHETGGTVNIRAHSRRGRKGGTHKVRAHSATFPARPYLKPGLEAVDTDLEGLFFREWNQELGKR